MFPKAGEGLFWGEGQCTKQELLRDGLGVEQEIADIIDGAPEIVRICGSGRVALSRRVFCFLTQ